MHLTYITAEAMTTAHVQVFMQCIFKPQGYTDQFCSKSMHYRPHPVTTVCN